MSEVCSSWSHGPRLADPRAPLQGQRSRSARRNNEVEGTFEDRVVRTALGPLEVDGSAGRTGDTVVLVRPEQLEVLEAGPGAEAYGEIVGCEFYGQHRGEGPGPQGRQGGPARPGRRRSGPRHRDQGGPAGPRPGGGMGERRVVGRVRDASSDRARPSNRCFDLEPGRRLEPPSGARRVPSRLVAPKGRRGPVARWLRRIEGRAISGTHRPRPCRDRIDDPAHVPAGPAPASSVGLVGSGRRGGAVDRALCVFDQYQECVVRRGRFASVRRGILVAVCGMHRAGPRGSR